MSGSLGSLVVELAANTARLNSDMGKALGIVERGMGSMSSAVGKFKNVLGGLGAGLAVSSIVGLARGAISYGDEIGKAASRSGIAAGEFSKLAAAAKQTDVDIGTLSKGIKNFQVAISNASRGDAAASEIFQSLGLDVAQLKALKPEDQLGRIADALGRVQDPADRARIGSELLGKAYLELVPLLEQGSAGLRELVRDQTLLGNTFTDDQIQKLGDADDAIKRLTASWDAFSRTLTAKVAPPLTAVLDVLSGANAGRQDKLIETSALLAGEIKDKEAIGYDVTALKKQRAEVEAQLAAFGKGPGGRGGSRGQFASSLQDYATGMVPRVGNPSTTADGIAKQSEATMADIIKFNQQAGQQLNAIWADELEATRGDFIATFNDLETQGTGALEAIDKQFGESTSTWSTFTDEAARNMQGALADFLFDPFKDGLRGMLSGFINVLRRMVAEAAASKIFEYLFGSKGKGGTLGTFASLFGFANGGSFQVGGTGGTDSQLVAFKASPNETVSVTKPGQGAGGGVVFAPTTNVSISGGASESDRAAFARVIAENNRNMMLQLRNVMRDNGIRLR